MVLRFAAGLLLVGLIVGAEMAAGQTYPNKPIRIFTADVGGGTDLAVRLMAPGLTASLGQQIIVENRGAV